MTDSPSLHIGIIGLGYVGLPLAIAFAKHHRVTGFDISHERIEQLRQNQDRTCEISTDALSHSTVTLSATETDLATCDIYIITVPTPVCSENRPDLTALKAASQLIAPMLRAKNCVIFESTVYPGATEQVCVPILEQGSALSMGKDFWVGYSPERVSPGSNMHQLSQVHKIVSGCHQQAGEFIQQLYDQIIDAGTTLASSIQVAETAKALENAQRDVNIALINECALLCEAIGIATQDVIQAAQTKWNFVPFQPGLVGGHCISVDPYYLIHRASQLQVPVEVLKSARAGNAQMAQRLAQLFIERLLAQKCHLAQSRVLVLGYTFKEDCPDVRGTQVQPLIQHLQAPHLNVDVFDPYVDPSNPPDSKLQLLSSLPDATEQTAYQAIIIAVAHQEFCTLTPKQLRQWLVPDGLIFDIKSIYPASEVDWQL